MVSFPYHFFQPLADLPLARYDTRMHPSPALSAKLRTSLLRWYSQNKRDLPWRHTHDPYKIWVSEIMLQQTQVATVIPYYHRWLKAFPSLSALARAPLSKALGLWAGLGYYRRVRMFHQAAVYVQKELRGIIPDSAEGLRKLPGIGRYTAGAIASIAWSEKTPVLDGNVIRILTRIFAISQDVGRPATLEKLWAVAASLLANENPGDLNQSLMELGATVCFPLTPQCPRCPVKKNCLALRKGEPLVYPVRLKKERQEKLKMAALVLRTPKNKVWLEKQAERARWGGLWMFPFWPSKNEMLSSLPRACSQPARLGIVRHAFTKYRITLEVFEWGVKKGPSLERRIGKWFAIADLARLALPSPHRKIAEMLTSKVGG